MYNKTLVTGWQYSKHMHWFTARLHYWERGKRNLEERINNENHWPQLLYVSGIECHIERFVCFAAYFSSFPKEDAFQSLEENLWTVNHRTEFPDFSLNLKISKIFPDLKEGITREISSVSWNPGSRDSFFAIFDAHGGPEAGDFARKNLKDRITPQKGFHSEE